MKKERIFIWGTGKNERTIREKFEGLMTEVEIIGYIDNNQNKHNTEYNGHLIYSPQEAIKETFDKIIIFSTFFEEIEEQLIDELSVPRNKIDNYCYFTKKRIINRYRGTDDLELKQIVDFIDGYRLEVFNYPYIEKYHGLDPEVFYDEQAKMFFVMHHSKKMYFNTSFKTKKEVKFYYRFLLIEQDKESPHRYLADDFDVREGDIVVDAGAAEGNFSLDIIEKVSKLYIIESDEGWIEALRHTFADYLDKIIIVPKMLTDFDGPETTKLDSVLSEADFIKMDIEGCELESLRAMENLIKRSEHIRLAVCCYHRDNDEQLIQKLLEDYGLHTKYVDGYMWSPIGDDQKYYNPKLRHGVIRAWK